MSRSPAGPSVTLHAIGAPGSLTVDRRGGVAPAGADWRLTWWVGAEDRWRQAELETAVRQTLRSDGAVVETSMRMPGGDIVQRAAVAAAAGGSLGVVELSNRGSLAVALAIVAVPTTAAGQGPEFESLGDSLLVDGLEVVRFDIAPRRVVALGRPDKRALLDRVAASEESGSATAGRMAAMVWPLPHTATRRIVIGLESAPAADAGAPTIDQLEAGWAAHLGRLPPADLPAGLDGDLRRLRVELLGPTPASAAAAGLVGLARCASGISPDIAALGDPLAGADETAAALVVAAEAARRLGALPAGSSPVESVLAAIERVRAASRWSRLRRSAAVTFGRDDLDRTGRSAWRRSWHRAGQLGGAELLDHLDEPAAAASIRRRLGDPPQIDELLGVLSPSAPAGSPLSVVNDVGLGVASAAADLRELLDNRHVAGPASTDRWTPEPIAPAAAALAIDRLVATAAPDGLDLLPVFAPSWRGHGVEVHDWPTVHGRLSYAVRWHGDRPALLWELDDPAASVRLSSSGLDAEWQTAEARGEVLLG